MLLVNKELLLVIHVRYKSITTVLFVCNTKYKYKLVRLEEVLNEGRSNRSNRLCTQDSADSEEMMVCGGEASAKRPCVLYVLLISSGDRSSSCTKCVWHESVVVRADKMGLMF